jgi:hypothetical protein
MRGREPALWGRHEFLDAYYDLFKVGTPSVLGAFVVPEQPLPGVPPQELDRGFGKTRLLRELTVQAIRDGHIPVVVSSDTPNWEPPKTLAQLLIALSGALSETREIYRLAKTEQVHERQVHEWQVHALQQRLQGNANATPLDPDVQQALEEANNSFNANVVREALAADMTYLIKQAHAQPLVAADADQRERDLARARHAFFEEKKGTAILFLDDVHKYDGQFVDQWFEGGVLGKGGLRRDASVRESDDQPWNADETILPVVMTYSTAGAPKSILNSVMERGHSLGWIQQEPLVAFPKMNDLDLLAYEHVLLNPFDKRGELREDVSNRAFALNRAFESREPCCQILRERFRGRPVYFTTSDCYQTVYLYSQLRFLLPADDERRLQEYMKK